MRRARAAVLFGALIASGAAATVAAWWWVGGAAVDGAGPPPVTAPPAVEPAAVRAGRVHVDPGAAAGAQGTRAPAPTVESLIAAVCGEGATVLNEDGSRAQWWGFPLDDVMPALLAVLERSDEMEWSGVRALETMREIGYLAAPWADDVARYLSHPVLGADAVVTLAAMGPGALPVVVRAVEDEDPRVREQGLLVLTEAGYRRREVVEVAVAALDDPDPDVRAAAVEVLATHDEAPDLSVPALTARIPLPGEEAPLDAVFALALYGPRAAEAVPALVRLIADRRERGGDAVIAALEAIGPTARPAVPTLLALLARDSAAYADAVPAAVLAISPDAFRAALSHDQPSVRAEFAARAGTMLTARGGREEELVTSLEALASDPSPEVRTAAARALSDVVSARGRERERVTWLRERLAAGAGLGAGGRVEILDLVAAEGPRARELAAALREFLHDPDDRVRVHAALAVWAVAPPAADVEPILRSYRDRAALRVELYRGLTKQPPASWAEHVAWLLHDEPERSRVIGAAYGMLASMGAAALDPLVRVAAAEKRADRISWIADLLAGIGAPAAPALRDLAARPGLPAPLHANLLRLAEEVR